MTMDQLKVLVIGDDLETIQQTLEKALENLGYELRYAAFDRATLSKLGADDLDTDALIIALPSYDKKSLDALRDLRAGRPFLPIIALVPTGQSDMGERLLAVNISEYLTLEEIEGRWLSRILHHAIEKSQAQQALQENQSRYQSLFSNNHASMIILDPDRAVIVDANPAACRFYGYSRAQLQNMPVSEISLNSEKQIRENLHRAAYSEQSRYYFQHRIASGEVRHIEVYSGPIEIEGRTLLYSLLHDITEHRETEDALRWESAVNAAVADLARALISRTDLEDIAVLVLEHARKLTGSDFGYVGYIEQETGALVSTSLTHDIWDSCEVPDKGVVFKEFKGLWGWVLENRQSILVNNPREDPRSTGIPEGHVPIHRFLSTPAMVNGELLGQVALANKQDPYKTEELEAAERLASLYALAVQRDRADKERQHYADEQRTLYTISAAIASLKEPEALLKDILDVMLEVLGGTAGWITTTASDMSDSNTPALIVKRGIDEELIPEVQAAASAICPLYSRLPHACDPPDIIASCPDMQEGLEKAFQKHICVPLHSGGKVLGALSILWDSDNPMNFSNDFLITVGQQIGVALRNAQLYKAARQVNRLQVLNNLDADLAATLEPDELAAIMLRRLKDAVNAASGSVILCQTEGTECIHYALHDRSDRQVTQETTQKPESLYALTQQLRREEIKAPASVTELQERWSHKVNPELLTLYGEETLLAPIWSKIELIGFLLLSSNTASQPFSTEDQALIQACAHRAGHALQNAQLYQASRAQSAHLAALNRIGRVAVSSLNPQKVMQKIVQMTCEAVDSMEGAILLTDEQTGGLRFAITLEEATEGLRGMTLEPGEGIAGWVAQQGKPAMVNDVQADPRFNPSVDAESGFQTHSLLCVPLVHHDEIVGVIEVVNKQQGPFTRQDLKLLESAASMAVAALENARLYNKTQKRAEELARINEIGLTLTSSLDISMVAEVALDQIRQLFDADLLSLLKVDEKGEGLRFVQTLYRGESREIQATLPPGKGLAGWVLKTGKAMIFEDVPSHPKFWSPILEHLDQGPRGLMIAPLSSQSQPTGVITVGSFEANVYTEENLRMLQALVPTLVVALENARLYEDLKRLLKEREQTQVQLVHTEKMAALGRLVASLAHEINNPLQAVQGCITLAHEELYDETYDKQSIAYYVDVAQEEIDRISVIIRRMRDFYRPSHQQYHKVDVHEILESVLALTNKQLQHSYVRIKREWSDTLPEIHANPDHLKQIFLNLVLNAADAMPEGGVLTVATEKATLPGERLKTEIPAVSIVFADSGSGMDEETLSHLFEPFFTTKPDGSGLGLSISYGLVKAHLGEIDVTSVVGQGTEMVVRLPITQAPFMT